MESFTETTSSTVHEFVSIAGDLNVAATEVEVLTRAGVDGVAIKDLGKRATESLLTCKRDVTAADLVAQLNTYAALVGKIVKVTYEDGRFVDDVALLALEDPRVEPIRSPIGGLEGTSGAYMITTQWRCIHTGAGDTAAGDTLWR